MCSNPIKIVFFPMNYKNRPAASGFSPRPSLPPAAGDSAPKLPSVICLSYSSLLKAYHNSDVLTF